MIQSWRVDWWEEVEIVEGLVGGCRFLGQDFGGHI